MQYDSFKVKVEILTKIAKVCNILEDETKQVSG